MEKTLVFWQLANIVLAIGVIVLLGYLCKWIYFIYINTKRNSKNGLNPHGGQEGEKPCK